MQSNKKSTTMGTSRVLHKFHENQSGAIMVMGLFMACFLVGALWYIIGIGDAIVFRDKMQEAADHGAFTSAVLHAKGMNFISACNLILFALVAIHIFLGVILDILMGIAIAGSFFLQFELWEDWWDWRQDVYGAYFKNVLKNVGDLIDTVEKAVAIGYPWLGAYMGYQVGQKYTFQKAGIGPNPQVQTSQARVFALSTAMVPGGALNRLDNTCGTSDGKKQSSPPKTIGLPVTAKPFYSVCDRIVAATGNAIVDIAKGAKNPSNKAWKKIKKLVESGIKFRYCNDKSGSSPEFPGVPGFMKVLIDAVGGLIDPYGFNTWWGHDGPLIPLQDSCYGNGSRPFQVLAINLLPEKYQDTSDPRVALAKKVYTHTPQELGILQGQLYIAQAEFYFDCTSTWTDSGCNGEDNAGYAINWRARLRRIKPMNWQGSVESANGELQGLIDQLLKIASYAYGDHICDSISNQMVCGVVRQLTAQVFQELGDKVGRPLIEAASQIQGVLYQLKSNVPAVTYH